MVIFLFNEVYYFWKSLNNVLAKEDNIDFEVIWINEGSIDGTQKLIDKIIEENSFSNIKNISIEF